MRLAFDFSSLPRSSKGNIPRACITKTIAVGIVLSLSTSVTKASLPPCLDGFSLYSDIQSIFRDRDSLASGKMGTNGYTELGIDGIVHGNLVSRGNILLRDRSKVYANVSSGSSVTLHSGAQVTGSIQQNASIPICALPQETFTVGTQDVNVNNGATTDLLPGAYRDVRVFGNGRLKLRAGTYRFKTLRTEADGRFEFNPASGNIEIFASTDIAIGDRTQFNFVGTTSPEKVKLHSQQTTSLNIGTDIQFRGILVAPSAEVHAYSRTVFRGAVYAKALNFEPDVIVHHVPYAGALPVVAITSPFGGYITNQNTINIIWTVNGVVQTNQTTENLLVEGNNKVKRCSGGVCDSINVVRDQTPPVVQITSPANGLVTNQTNIGIAWTVDGVTQITETNQTLLEGQNTITRTATDAAGNTGTASINVTRDTQAPVVVISSPANGTLTNQPTIAIAWSVDGVAQTTQTTQSLPVEGSNTITRSITDAAGNTGYASITVVRDTQAPYVVIQSPVGGLITNQTSIAVAWTVDGVSQSSGITETLIAEGLNTITRTAIDAAGNVGSSSVTVIRDTEAPVVVITNPANGMVANTETIAVAWTVDGVTQTSGLVQALEEGLNSITRSFTDAAGNVGTSSITVIRDTQAPIVVITSPANGYLTSALTLPVSWTVDGIQQTDLTTENLTVEGANVITRTITDAAGNTGNFSITVYRDTEKPVVAITNPLNGFITNQTSISVSWSVDGVLQHTETSENLVLEGLNFITRSFIDSSGNEGVDSIAVIRDTQAPIVTILDPTEGRGFNTPVIDIHWAVDGIVQQQENTETLHSGTNIIKRKSIDAAGNSDSVLVTVYLDTTAPIVHIVSPLNGSVVHDSVIPVIWTVDGVVQGFSNEANLDIGQNKIIRAFADSLGNIGADTVVATFTTDPPVVQILSPLNGETVYSSPVNVIWLVDGAVQDTLTSEVVQEGVNIITREAFGAGGNTQREDASIWVNLDSQVEICQP